MADLADEAEDFRLLHMGLQLAAAARAKPVIEPQGHCLFCGAEQMPDGSPWRPEARWCDVDCRSDWSRATGVR